MENQQIKNKNMVYANFDKTLENWEEQNHQGLYKQKNILSTKEYTTDDKSPSFYYDRHDASMRGIEFNSFLDFNMWKVFKENKNSKIIINFSDDYLNILDLKKIGRTIKIKGLDGSRIYFITMDNLFTQFVEEEFKKVGIKNIKVSSYPFLLKNVCAPQNTLNETSNKFSCLSRNYHPWRLELYIRLIKENMLDNFNYSFHNLRPYSSDPSMTLGAMKADVIKNNLPLTPEITQWLEGIPYDIGTPQEKWSDCTYDAIYSADFHLLVESHFDCYLDGIWSFAQEDYNERDFAPSFATEKTYKAINCKKPFIAVSTPYFLDGIKKMGFKTFSPYIDESYDNITNNGERMQAIVEEVKKICTLPQDEYENLINNLKPIVEYNLELFIKLNIDNTLLETHDFLKQIFPFTSKSMKLPIINPEIY